MKTILHISSSPHGENSVSKKLGKSIAGQLQQANDGAVVKLTDLGENPFPHLDAKLVQAIRTKPEDLTEEQKEILQGSDAAIKDIMNADAIVISIPFFNFGIPSVIKAWLDHVVRAGVTFRYGENGPVGLVTGKKVYLAVASGGVYSDGPMQAYDHAVPYLKSVLGFIGITDVSVVRAEGMGIPALKDLALEKALAEFSF
ncbi:FMN-dependent NADH-azoreductase [Nostoc linckia z13]|uniref:FMN-dependent NADH-azoreductase n=1 Tax=Nostoc linckia TaxID=92942 RepID=UPI000BFFD8A2|nr:FMN-dependent NADH-azoreductase [Nostoc linckia z13]